VAGILARGRGGGRGRGRRRRTPSRPPGRSHGPHPRRPAMSRTRTRLTCCAALLAALAFPSAARPLVDVSIVDREDGRLLPQYRHAGDRWIAGTPGHRYAVRLANTTDRRVLVVLSVDGVNAVTGEDADPSQAGYVLE